MLLAHHVLLVVLAVLQVPDSTGGGASSTDVEQETAPEPVELTYLRGALGEVEQLRKSGELDEARKRLGSMIESEEFRRLLDREPASAARCMVALGRSAIALKDDAVLTKVVRGLSSVAGPHNADLLDLREQLGLVRFRSGDVNGAHEMFAIVYAELDETLDDDEERLLWAALRFAATSQLLGDLDVALRLLDHVHTVRQQKLPADDPSLLLTKSNLGSLLLTMGDRSAALEIFEEVHDVCVGNPRVDVSRLLTSKTNLANARRSLGDLEGALALFEEVRATRAELFPPGDRRRLQAELEVGATLRLMKDLQGALELLEAVHDSWEESLHSEDKDLLRARYALAATYQELGRSSEAHALVTQAHDVAERVLPANDSLFLSTKLLLAQVLVTLGDPWSALDHIRVVHDTWERLLPEDHVDLLAAKQVLANVLRALGDVWGAQELEEQALATCKRSLPEGHPLALILSSNLAATLRAKGEYQRAFRVQEHVWRSMDGALPEESRERLEAMQQLALTRRALGDLDGGLELMERVHSIREGCLPPDNPDLLHAKLNLAVLRKDHGDLSGALELEEHLIEAWSRLLPPDDPDLLRVTQNLANTRARLGDAKGAVEVLGSVVERGERVLPPTHLDRLRFEMNLGSARFESGDLPGALEAYERVYSVLRDSRPEGSPDLLLAATNLGLARRASGDLEGAVELVDSVLRAQLVRAEELQFEAPRVARAVARKELHRLSMLMHAGRPLSEERPGIPDADLWRTAEALRAASTASSEVMRAAVGRQELAELLESLRRVRAEIGNVGAVSPRTPAHIESWRSSLVELAARRDELASDLRSALEESGVVEWAPTPEVASVDLEQGEALVSYWRYTRYFPRDPDTGRQPASVSSMLAFVVTPDSRVERVDLGPASHLERLTEDWRRAMGKPILRGEGLTEGPPNELVAGAALRDALVEPCLRVLEDTPERLHLILDDFLYLVPLDALPWRSGEAEGGRDEPRRLGDVMAVLVETSARRSCSKSTTTAAPEDTGTFVAIGGPAFDADVIEASSSEEARTSALVQIELARGLTWDGLRDLPNTRREVQGLGELFTELHQKPALVLTGEDASKSSLLEHAHEARYLHIATHGWFSSEAVESSADDRELRLAEQLMRTEDAVRGFAPEILCGLALAGARRGRHPSGRVPGVITAEELAGLDLSRCDLAVLSACETNVGIRRAGQGIQSLQSALHEAGARSAVTSLWPVDDAVTRELMEVFYLGIWEEGRDKASALWAAKRSMRAQGDMVSAWAGWVLTGDPD